MPEHSPSRKSTPSEQSNIAQVRKLVREVVNRDDTGLIEALPPNPVWRIQAWATAPGDFPQRLLHSTEVAARNIANAVQYGQRALEQEFLQPTLVSVERINPPVQEG